jgi:phosphotriesterase-related protein
MDVVNSVTGPVAVTDLGFTLIHEHVSVGSAGIWRAWPELYGGRGAVLARAIDHLREAKAEGVETFVDATPIDLGRDVQLLREVAEGSGIRIVASTGYWLDMSRTMQNRTVDELTSFFIREIRDGIEDTSIKAGVIKVATHESVTEFGERVLRAACRTLKSTGTPIITHSGAKFRNGEVQADVFESESADPRKIAIGHSDDTTDLDYLTGLLKRGFWLALDRLPLGALADYQPPDVAGRIELVAQLLDLGYADQLLLSHDDPIHLGISPVERQKRNRAANPDIVTFISRRFLPALRERGVDEATITRLMVDNPRRLFQD